MFDFIVVLSGQEKKAVEKYQRNISDSESRLHVGLVNSMK